MRTFNIVINDKTYAVVANNEDYMVEGWINRLKIMDGYLLKYKLKDWSFEFSYDLPNRIVAATHQEEKQIEFNITAMFLLPWEWVKYTMLHEIAHALTPNDHCHGKEWQLRCLLLGLPIIPKLPNKMVKNDDGTYRFIAGSLLPDNIHPNDAFPGLAW